MKIKNLLIILTVMTSLTRSYGNSGIREFNDISEESCTSVEVDTADMPDNRYQGSSLWCHAYGTADLMSFYSKHKISSYAIAALTYKVTVLDKELTNPRVTKFAGNAYLDFFYVTKYNKGLCLESNYTPSSGDWKKLTDSYLEIDNKLHSKNLNEVTERSDKTTLSAINKLSGSNFVTALINTQCIEKVPVPDGTLRFIFANGQMNCQTISGKINCKVINERINELPVNEWIDEKLSSSEPVIIGIDTNLFGERSGRVNANYNHESTVIGRRFNKLNSSCEYKIRNSWGTDCKKYPKKLQGNCDEGNLWIPRMDVLKSIGGITIFDKSN